MEGNETGFFYGRFVSGFGLPKTKVSKVRMNLLERSVWFF